MSTIALLISQSEVKASSHIDENVDDKILAVAIQYAQEEYTKAILGTALYDEIVAQIIAGTLTASNTTLRNSYIKKALLWWVIYEATDELHTKYTNKSVMQKKSDNSEPVDLNTILALKSKYRNRAERMDQKTIDYLRENSTTFPLYGSPGTGSDTIHPKSSTYNTGWYLGDSGNDSYNTPSGNCCE